MSTEPLNARHARGVTLVELMIVVALVAILGALTAPAFRDLINRHRVQAASDALQAAIVLARIEALRRGAVMALAPGTCSSGGWTCGWAVVVDATSASLRQDVPPSGVSVERLTGSGAYLVGPRTPPAIVRFRFTAGASGRQATRYLCFAAVGGFLSTEDLSACDAAAL